MKDKKTEVRIPRYVRAVFECPDCGNRNLTPRAIRFDPPTVEIDVWCDTDGCYMSRQLIVGKDADENGANVRCTIEWFDLLEDY